MRICSGLFLRLVNAEKAAYAVLIKRHDGQGAFVRKHNPCAKIDTRGAFAV